MAVADKTLVCRDCGSEFVFSTREQAFYAEKGFQNDPARCPACRAARKQQNRNRRPGPGNRISRSDRQMYRATCSACGAETEVPFKPSGDRPVYCRDCYQNR